MTISLNRRRFLKGTAVSAAAAASVQLFPAPALLAAPSLGSKLGMAVIGANGRGLAHVGVAASERLVALVDVDDRRMAGSLAFLTKTVPGFDAAQVKTYYDFRKMFDETHKQLDAVFVATPDNTHACIAMTAIKLGKHVYCEKPLTHDIYEARALGEAARQHQVMTQMGNQGHAGEGIRVLREYLEAGAIGTVLEAHVWQDQVYGVPKRQPNKPVPPGLHWNEWIGPGAYCEFRDGMHPSCWYQWKDYGTGLLACVGVHTFDAVHWGLQLKYPTSVVALEQQGQTADAWGGLNTLLYEFPRPGLPPLNVYWYDGVRNLPFDEFLRKQLPPSVRKARNHPRLADELTTKYGRDLTNGGSLFVGEKGYLVSGVYSDSPRLVPEQRHQEFPQPAKKYPRTHGIHADFLRACKEGGDPPSSNFPDVSGPYIEALLVGNLAMRAGVGKKVQWDGPNMKCTNLPELNEYVKREYRQGWTL
jgi:predicted dehydrogenase